MQRCFTNTPLTAALRISFASQLPAHRFSWMGVDDGHVTGEEKSMGRPAEEASQVPCQGPATCAALTPSSLTLQAAAQVMLGEVDSQRLLLQAGRECPRAKDRRRNIEALLAAQRDREIRIAAVFTEEVGLSHDLCLLS